MLILKNQIKILFKVQFDIQHTERWTVFKFLLTNIENCFSTLSVAGGPHEDHPPSAFILSNKS